MGDKSHGHPDFKRETGREREREKKKQKIIAELLARAKRAQSGAPWVRKFGKLSI